MKNHRLSFIVHHSLGSAMLIALSFAGLITVISLGVGKLIGEEVRQNTRYRDSVEAFYAAEAGLNDTMYRIKQDPFSVNNLPQFGVNLANNNAISSEPDLQNLAAEQSGYWVELNLNPAGTAGHTAGTIGRDDPLEIFLDSDWMNQNFQIKATKILQNNTDRSNRNCVAWIAKAYVTTEGGAAESTAEQFLGEYSNIAGEYAITEVGTLGGLRFEIPQWSDSASRRAKLRIIPRVVTRNSSQACTTVVDEVASRPSNSPAGRNWKIQYEITIGGAEQALGLVEIKSTGYAGKTRRAIRQLIDLTAGGGQSVLDYVIYSGGNVGGSAVDY